MTRRYLLWSTSVVVLGATSCLRGCDCGRSPRGGDPRAWTCAADGRPDPGVLPCGSGQRFAFGECEPERCDAPGSPGCCPGTVCTGGGACVVPASRVHTCLTDADCAASGERCLTRPRVKAEASTCGVAPVAADGTCASGQPFDHRCFETAPCGGSCAAGKVCNVDLGFCEDQGAVADATCAVTCGAGELLVYTDPDLMLFDACCEVACACLPLPGVPAGVWGRHADLAVAGDVVLTSAYDSTYGDLVVARWDGASVQPGSLEWIDGVPADGPVVASPGGPRGGRDAPGPDVGLHGSLVLAGGEPRVVYYDAGAGDLKLASHDATGWSTSLVDDGRDLDGGDGDVGRYTSLAVDAAGVLHAAYYLHRATRGGTLVSGVMYARSRTPTPAGYDDWDHVPVELVASCDDRCEPGVESCVQRDGQPTCAPPSTSCASACDCDQTCVEGPAGPACETALPSSLVTDAQGLPYGVGLFASLALRDGTPMVAYYDHLRHQARAAVGGATGFDVAPLACAAGQNVGRHTSLAVTGGGVAVALQGDDGAGLWVCTGGTLAECRARLTLIDDGVRAPGDRRRVGAYASLAADAGGELYVAYQDQTMNDLELAYTRQGEWRRQTLADTGARGYFARLRLDGATGWAADFVIDRDTSGRDHSHLELLPVDLTGLP